MIRKIFLSVIVLLLSACSQTAVQNKTTTHDVNILKRAIGYADPNSAINSLYQIIELEGPESVYLDSLGLIYFQTGRYASAELVILDMLRKDSTNTTFRELLAISQNNQGKAIPAIESYERLFSETQNSFYAYQLANLQYRIKRLAEAYLTVQTAEQLPISADIKVNVIANENQLESVSLHPAVYNLKGAIEFELFPDSLDAAQASFEKALELYPDFIVAKKNLDFLMSRDDEK